jgi:hypothetical protein
MQPFNTNRLQIDSTLDYAVDGPSEFVFFDSYGHGMNRWSTKNLQIDPPTFRTYCDAIGQCAGLSPLLKVVPWSISDRACRCQCA